MKDTKFCHKWKALGRKGQFIQALEHENNKTICTMAQSCLLLEVLTFDVNYSNEIEVPECELTFTCWMAP